MRHEKRTKNKTDKSWTKAVIRLSIDWMDNKLPIYYVTIENRRFRCKNWNMISEDYWLPEHKELAMQAKLELWEKLKPKGEL